MITAGKLTYSEKFNMVAILDLGKHVGYAKSRSKA
jgi:hypothetical protein